MAGRDDAVKQRAIVELSRRERQIMDIVYRLREASAADVCRELPDPPSYSAVRALLAILERKGRLRHFTRGPRYVYAAAHAREDAGRSALQRVVHTFFEGSLGKAVAAHLTDAGTELSDEERRQLTALIRDAKRKGQ